jgi:translation initiation factor IF-1
MDQAEAQVAVGAVTEVGPNLLCRVRLDAGGEVPARIPGRIARLMFRVVPGDRVRVRADGTGGYAVLGHERVRG